MEFDLLEDLEGGGIVEDTELPTGDEAEAVALEAPIDLSTIEDCLITIETQQNSEFLLLTEINESLLTTNDHLQTIQDYSYVLAVTALFCVVLSVIRRWVYSWERRL